MAATAGYNATLKVGGTPTTFTDQEATRTNVGVTPAVYQLAAPYLNLDPATAVVLTDELDAPVAEAATIDYLKGTVTFADEPSFTTLQVSGKYIPVSAVALCTASSIGMSMAELDTSQIGVAYTEFAQGQATAEGTLTILEPLDTVLNGDALTWQALFDGRDDALLEVTFNSMVFRAWIQFPGLGTELSPDAAVEGTVTWKSSQRKATDNTEVGFVFTAA